MNLKELESQFSPAFVERIVNFQQNYDYSFT